MGQPITIPIKSVKHQMTSFNRSTNRATLIVLTSLLLLLPFKGHTETVPTLLTPLASAPLSSRSHSSSPMSDPTIIRQRYVGLNVDVLPQPEEMSTTGFKTSSTSNNLLRLQLFDDVGFNVILAQTTASIDGIATTWSGFIDGMPESQVVIVQYQHVIAGNMTTADGKVYQLRYTQDGHYVVREMDLQALPPTHPATPPPEKDLINLAPIQGTKTSTDPTSNEDDNGIITLMVVYTSAARSAVGGTSAINALIALAIAETNEGYANSDVIPRLRLVHQQEVSYTEPQNNPFDQALQALTSTSDGQLDEVHAWRDEHGADLVSLVIEDQNSCGLAWQNDNPSPADERWAFSVVMHACIAGNYSLGHELGHTMGAHHDRPNASSRNMPYAYGYQEPSEAFRTIMAYNCNNGCPRVNHWSNPRVSVRGRATGVEQSDPNAADNHLALNNAYKTVAKWRTTPTSSPSAVSIQVTASGHESGNEPDHTLDKNLQTRWSTNLKPESITYQLRYTTEVKKVDISWFKGNERSAAFEIATSRDNQNWSEVYRGRSGGRSTHLETYSFNHRSAKFVRIRGYGNNSQNSFMWNSITEVVIRDRNSNKIRIAGVWATRHQAGNPPNHTTDGDFQTRWSAALTPAWAIYDLGSAQPIETVKIAWFKGNERTNGFELAVSQDKQNWQGVYQGKSSGNTRDLETVTIGRQNARYLRLQGYGNSNQTSFMWNSITELEICHAGGCY